MAGKTIVFGIYVSILWAYLSVMCAVFFGLGWEITTIDDPKTEYISQISVDWTAVPFVDIVVTDEWTCDESTQLEVFTRPWYGTVMACDCLDSCSTSEYVGDTWCFEMLLDESCDSDKIKGGCFNNEPYPLIWQNQFLGKRVCGTLGGDPFLNVTRPDASTLACPSGTKPCLDTTIANETVCYPPDDLASKCPITDIMLVDASAVGSYEDLGYTSRTFNETASLVFSRTVPQLPPTTIKVEQEPCMDALQQSSSPGEQYYLPELMKNGCTTEANTGLVYDPRFSASGLYTDLYSVQTENSVTSILEA